MSTFVDAEHPRDQVGRFAEKEHSAPEAELGTSEGYRLGDPVNVTIYLEQWVDHEDRIETVDDLVVDARAVFDTVDLDDLPDEDGAGRAEELDWVFEHLSAHGAVDHDGPFTVYLPDNWDEYVNARREAGLESAPRGAFIDSPQAVEARLAALRAEEEQLARRREVLIRDYAAAAAANAYPNADRVVLDFRESPKVTVHEGANSVEVSDTEAAALAIAVQTAVGEWRGSSVFDISLRG